MNLACLTALASSWSVGVPLKGALRPDGLLELPAGVAALVITEGAPVEIVDPEGLPLPLRGVEGGLLVPAAGTGRALRIDAPEGSKIRVHRSDDDGDATRWERWEYAAAAALRRGEPLPDLPTCQERLRAGAQLRAAATGDVALSWLGLQMDLAAARPLTSASHALGPELPLMVADTPTQTTVEGPGVLLIRALTPLGPLTRFALTPVVGGRPGQPLGVASTGSAPVTLRVALPPGPHTLALEGVPPGVQVWATEARLRPRAFSLSARPAPAAQSLAAAELAFIGGDHAKARADFSRLVALPGAAGELARLRLILLEEDPRAALARALSVPRSAEGAEVLAEAVLRRAAELPAEDVLAVVLAAADPDPVALARWMDDLGGLRPRGLALLDLASGDVPEGPSLAARAVRQAAWASAWTSLQADPALVGRPVLSAEGPGVPRVRLVPGASATATLPVLARQRVPVLRLWSAGPVRFLVDGQPWASAFPGALDLALPPGEHRVQVVEGELLLLDAEVVQGGERLYAWQALELPITWALPEPGLPVDLRVRLLEPAAEPLRLSFDDGRELLLRPGADGSYPTVRAGPFATRLRLEGPAGALGGAAMRASVVGLAASPPLTPLDEAEGLAALARLSPRVVSGDRAARLERAEVLARLGLLGPSREDLALLLQLPAWRDDAARLAARVAAPVPSAPAVGPRSVAVALDAAGLHPETLPETAEALEALARQSGSEALWTAAGEAWMARGALAPALDAAAHAGAAGADLQGALEARARWSLLSRADRGAGLVEVTRAPAPPDPAAPLWKRAQEAMLPSPWAAGEDLLLREGWGALLRHPGGAATLALICLDERGGDAPCPVRVRVDETWQTVEVPPGLSPRLLEIPAATGPRELEIAPPERGLALRARASVDGALVPLQTRQLALRASPGRPIGINLASPLALRVEVVRGAVVVRGQTVSAGQALVLPLLDPVAAALEISGDGDVLLWRGELGPEPEDAAPLEASPPPPPARLPLEALAPLYDRVASPPAPERARPDDAGTSRLGASAISTRLPPVGETWRAGELEAAWLRSRGPRGLSVTAWSRGPQLAAGAALGLTRRWEGGWAGVEARGGAGTGIVESAGSAALSLRARQDLPLLPDHTLRVSGRVVGAISSPEPATPVDPRAWSRWSLDHPVHAQLDLRWIGSPWRDLVASVGVQATSNSGPSLDALAAQGSLNLLFNPELSARASLGARWRFADEHRAQSGLTLSPRLGVAWDRWLTGGRRLTSWGLVGLDGDQPELQAGVALWWTGGRGLYDLEPDSLAFRTARGRP